MATMTHDNASVRPASRFGAGLTLAVLSSMSFGLSGTLAKGLLTAGWSPAAAVTARIVVAALVLLVPGLLALGGRWSLLRRNLRLVVAYGLVAIAGCQFAYFSSVEHLQVGVALLIEYTAPAAVIGWLWLRHGHRPGVLTTLGCLVAAGGLVLVLDLVSGAGLHPLGVLWALLAMVGAATYFVLSAQEDNGLPPLVLASAGMLVGAAALVLLGVLGLLDMTWSTAAASYDGVRVPWWWSMLGLGVVSAAIAYTTGIAASRRLGSRVASFVSLLEVIFALVFAWLMLGELPRTVQFVGGGLVLGGVVLVKLGERATRSRTARRG